MTSDLPQVAINLSIREDLRDVLNSFVGWLNRRHPQRNLQTGKRDLWNQSEAMELILECQFYWHEFVNENAFMRAGR